MFNFFRKKSAEPQTKAPPPAPAAASAPEPEEPAAPAAPTLAELKKQVEDNPANAQAALAAARMLHEMGQTHYAQNLILRTSQVVRDTDVDATIELLSELKKMGAATTESHFMLTEIFREQKRYPEAEQEIRGVLRHDLNNMEALSILAELLIANGKHRDAVLTCTKLVGIDPRDPIAREKLGDAHAAMDNKEDAVKAWLLSAMHYVQMQSKEDALRLYDRVLEVDPGNPTAARERSNLSS